MKYRLRPTSKFQRDLKRVERRGYDLSLLRGAIQILERGDPLPPKYRDHPLTGEYIGCRECHITPDWLLVYEVREGELILILTRTGTHSDLF